MPDLRLNLLKNWLAEIFAPADFSITIASDDASFRRYFRIKSAGKTFIAMDAPPDKENTAEFVRIDKLLIAGNVHSPAIFHKNLEQGFLLLEDFGNQTFLDAQKQLFTPKYYQNAIDILIKIQAISVSAGDIPAYDNTLLTAEMQLLTDWYLPPLSANQQAQLDEIFALLSANALNAPQVFVHRDYHSRNLMLLDNELGILDFQDAVIGANTYDLASLLRDAYFEIDENELQNLLKYYYQKANISTNISTDFATFEKQFELMGLQRYLKVLGIFKRLAIRDGKFGYLQNIPLVEKYALAVAEKYPELQALKVILQSVSELPQAMILAAGRGKRMMPLTKNTPKPLIKIQNKPLIEHSINSLKRANIKHIVINTSYLAQQLKSHLGNGADFGVHIIYSNEENSPLETAGGIIKALPLLGKRPFLVLNSDVICDYDLSKFKLPAGSLAHLLLVDNPAHNPAGDFTLSAAGAVKIQAENPLTFAGIGIYHPDFFQEYLGKTQKIPLAKLFKKASKNQQLSGEYFGGFWQDIGTPESVEFANNS